MERAGTSREYQSAALVEAGASPLEALESVSRADDSITTLVELDLHALLASGGGWEATRDLAFAHEALEGQGNVQDLVVLRGIAGLAPGLPSRAAHLLNTSGQARLDLVSQGTYLARPSSNGDGPFVRIQGGGSTVLAVPLEPMQPPFTVPSGPELVKHVFGRVCLSAWRWS